MSRGIEKEFLAIWAQSRVFLRRLDRLDNIEANKAQRAAIVSVQASFRDFQFTNLGELLNLFDLPPEKRK
jgi:hypothetical protein